MAFFLGGLDFAGAGGGLAVGEVSGDGLGLAIAGEEILACSSACARRSERDWTFCLSFFTVTSFITTASSVIVCNHSLAGEGFWGLGMGSSRRGVGGVDRR